MAQYKLNFPIVTDEAYAFWESRHKLNRIKAIIAFSLDLDNANDNLRRAGYYRQYRKRYLDIYGCIVHMPDMKDIPFSPLTEHWWDPIHICPLVTSPFYIKATPASSADNQFLVTNKNGVYTLTLPSTKPSINLTLQKWHSDNSSSISGGIGGAVIQPGYNTNVVTIADSGDHNLIITVVAKGSTSVVIKNAAGDAQALINIQITDGSVTANASPVNAAPLTSSKGILTPLAASNSYSLTPIDLSEKSFTITPTISGKTLKTVFNLTTNESIAKANVDGDHWRIDLIDSGVTKIILQIDGEPDISIIVVVIDDKTLVPKNDTGLGFDSTNMNNVKKGSSVVWKLTSVPANSRTSWSAIPETGVDLVPSEGDKACTITAKGNSGDVISILSRTVWVSGNTTYYHDSKTNLTITA